jgi:thiol-disulfide isomerase/thioredoxin
MKTFIALLFCFTLFGCKPKTEAKEAPAASAKSEINQAAPPFTLESTEGKKVSLSDFKGKVVLLDFWATWCPPCKMSMPALIKLGEKMKGKDLVVIGIDLGDNPTAVKNYIKNMGIDHLILYNGNSGIEEHYNVRAIPTFYIIDQQGAIYKNYAGYYPGLENEFEKDINLLLAKK